MRPADDERSALLFFLREGKIGWEAWYSPTFDESFSLASTSMFAVRGFWKAFGDIDEMFPISHFLEVLVSEKIVIE